MKAIDEKISRIFEQLEKGGGNLDDLTKGLVDLKTIIRQKKGDRV